MVEARQIDRPTAGCYAIRLVRNGPLVPARLDYSDGRWLATVDGVAQNYAYSDDEIATTIMVTMLGGKANTHKFVRIHGWGKMITEAEYQRMLDLRTWAAVNSPDHPCLHPMDPIDRSKLPSLWSVLCPRP